MVIIAGCIVSKYIHDCIKEKSLKPDVLPQDKNQDKYVTERGYSFPYYDVPHDYDTFHRVAIPRNFLKSTNDRYRFRPFVSSVDARLADDLNMREVDTAWENVGIATAKKGDTILQLWRRPIDPRREWYEYRVIDRDGIVIPLSINITFLENGDNIGRITGYESRGDFIANIFDEFKYVYV